MTTASTCGEVIDETTRRLCGVSLGGGVYRWCPLVEIVETELTWFGPWMTLTEDDTALGSSTVGVATSHSWSESAGLLQVSGDIASFITDDDGLHDYSGFTLTPAVTISDLLVPTYEVAYNDPATHMQDNPLDPTAAASNIWHEISPPYFGWHHYGFSSINPITGRRINNAWSAWTRDANNAGDLLIQNLVTEGPDVGTYLFTPTLSLLITFGVLAGAFHGRQMPQITDSGDTAFSAGFDLSTSVAYFNATPFPLPGVSYACAANNDGLVVGDYIASGGTRQAFLWDTATATVTFPADDAGYTGVVQWAGGINDLGNLIFTTEASPGDGPNRIWFLPAGSTDALSVTDQLSEAELLTQVVIGELNESNHFLASNYDPPSQDTHPVFIVKVAA